MSQLTGRPSASGRIGYGLGNGQHLKMIAAAERVAAEREKELGDADTPCSRCCRSRALKTDRTLPSCHPLPRVINGIQTSDLRNLFNPENIFISKEGGGAGNNWASGYTQGEAVQETLLDMIGECSGRRRVELL